MIRDRSETGWSKKRVSIPDECSSRSSLLTAAERSSWETGKFGPFYYGGSHNKGNSNQLWKIPAGQQSKVQVSIPDECSSRSSLLTSAEV